MSDPTGKRVGRGVAEFMLIVVGVLVALAADEFMQSRAQLESEESFLAALRLETEGQIDSNERALRLAEEAEWAVRSLLELAEDGFETEDPNQLAMMLHRTARTTTPTGQSEVFEQLAGPEGPTLLRSRELRMEILVLYRRFQFAQGPMDRFDLRLREVVREILPGDVTERGATGCAGEDAVASNCDLEVDDDDWIAEQLRAQPNLRRLLNSRLADVLSAQRVYPSRRRANLALLELLDEI